MRRALSRVGNLAESLVLHSLVPYPTKSMRDFHYVDKQADITQGETKPVTEEQQGGKGAC